MSGAQNWNLKGIDPKVREAAREAAARQGMSLGEYLNNALANHQPSTQAPQRTRRYGLPHVEIENDEEDWRVADTARSIDPARLAQRIESIERRTQLAVTGLDRAVSTIDRSLLGLAARVEDAEAVSTETADRIADALEQFRIAGDTIGGSLERAEREVAESRRALDYAKSDLTEVKGRLETQVVVAEEIARRAEAAATFLSSELQNRDETLAHTLSAAREVAEEAARQATEASADAVKELRRLQESMRERLAETEISTRRAVASAIEEVRAETSIETRGTREALLEEVVRLESEIAKRVGAVDVLKADHASLIERIERAEAGARETTAGLRQAAGAAIADLRNAQLTLAARLKQIEDAAGAGGVIDVTDLRQSQQDIAERLAALENSTRSSPVAEALASFERRLANIEAGGNDTKLDEVGSAVETMDHALRRLAERIAETESTANTAIRTLEETVSSLGARVEAAAATQETEAVRAMLEQRLDVMAQSVHQMVGEARSELAGQLQAALDGEGFEGALTDVNRRLAAAERRQAQTIEAISLEIRRMSETVDMRLRAVEMRNDDAAAVAVREELSRMAATLEARFDEIERREAAAFDRMGLEVGRLSERLEERVGAVEVRSAQAIEQVGEQVARMAERFNQRQEAMSRDLGERMLDSEERSGARVAEAISSIMQRLAEVEQHSAEAIAPVQKAVSGVASKLDRYESAHGGGDDIEVIPTPSRRAADFIDFVDFGELETSPMEAARPTRAAPLPPLSHEDEPQAAADDATYYLEEAADPHPQSDADDNDASLIFDETPVEPPPPLQTGAWAPPSLPEAEDLLMEDAAGDASTLTAPPPDDSDPFWAPEENSNAEIPLARHEEEPPPIEFAEEEPRAPSKNDYLANARRAAQAQASSPRGEAPGAPRLSLRGSSRIILWGAASVITLLLIGGAKFLNDQQNAAPATTDAQPDAAPPPAEATPPADSFEAPPPDPFAQAPADGAAPGGDPAIAQNPAPQPAAVAGPLAPRNVSLEQAAQAGNLTAQYELALQRLAAGRTQEGVALLRSAADRGFAMAQYRLAKLYERGEGVQADLNQARQWTERAAASGNRRAMHDLGVFFARGEGAPLDEAAAFRWFRQAAELGVADSQYNLGVLYQQGRGVSASAPEALFWFLVAARQGDQDAGARATALEAQLQQPQIDQARARAQAFRPRAASAVANGEFGARPWARPAT